VPVSVTSSWLTSPDWSRTDASDMAVESLEPPCTSASFGYIEIPAGSGHGVCLEGARSAADRDGGGEITLRVGKSGSPGSLHPWEDDLLVSLPLQSGQTLRPNPAPLPQGWHSVAPARSLTNPGFALFRGPLATGADSGASGPIIIRMGFLGGDSADRPQ